MNPHTRSDTPEILFEDAHILVCVKPHGIATQSRTLGKPDMVSLLKNHIHKTSHAKGEPYLAVIHRLDQPVTGILVFAKTPFAASSQVRASVNTTAPSWMAVHQSQKVSWSIILSKIPAPTCLASVVPKFAIPSLQGCVTILFQIITDTSPVNI